MRHVFYTLFILTTLNACVTIPKGTWGYQYNLNRKSVTGGSFQIDFANAVSGTYATNYYVCVTVTNIGNQPKLFSSDDFDLVNEKTGVSYMSVAKDKTEVRLNQPGIIIRNTLQPGQKIQGQLMFETVQNGADVESLQLKYGKEVVRITKVKERGMSDQSKPVCGS